MILAPAISTQACNASGASRRSDGRTAITTVWAICRRRSIQLSAIARGRHLVANGNRQAARSTCAARRRARRSSQPPPVVPKPSVPRQRSNGRTAIIHWARHKRPIAATVPKRPRHFSAFAKQALFPQPKHEGGNVTRNLLLLAGIEFRRKLGAKRGEVARPVDQAPDCGGRTGQGEQLAIVEPHDDDFVVEVRFGEGFGPFGDRGHLGPGSPKLRLRSVTYSAASATPWRKPERSRGRTKRAIAIWRARRPRWANCPERSSCRAAANR